MLKTTLIEYPHVNSLNESFQANDIKFAFVNPKDNQFEMVHQWVKCREYFNEFLMANYHEDFEFVQTYGFSYRKDEYPYDLSATRIALKFPDAKQKKTFLDNLNWLHKIETINGVELTTIHEINDTQLVVVSSKLWIEQCLLTNIYTLLLKLMALNISSLSHTDINNLEIKAYRPSELAYIQRITPQVLNNILENCAKIATVKSKYKDGTNILRDCGSVHGSSGLIQMNSIQLKQTSKDEFPKLSKCLEPIFKSTATHNFIPVPV